MAIPRLPATAALFTLLASALAGCGTAAGQAGPPRIDSGDAYVTTAQANVAADYRGTLRKPDQTPRPATTGKKVAILSIGQQSITSSTPTLAAVAAGQALGWTTTLYDAKLNPALAPVLMQQALDSGADGLIVDAMDCPLIAKQLAEARQKGVKVIPIFAFDCNDPLFGGTGSPLFSGSINYGPQSRDVGTFTADYGADQADAVIAHTHGHARVILFNDPVLSVLQYTTQGFRDELAKCADCKVVQEVDFHPDELGPRLGAKAGQALAGHPEANAVRIPYGSASLAGISQAVVAAHRPDLYSIGGDGFEPELDLIRAHAGVDAINMIDDAWVGWAAADSLNSIFLGKNPVDSGIGFVLADARHNLPKTGPYTVPIDYRAAYKRAWGVEDAG
jgi:ribose transport system substrate-binding protein